MIPSSRSTVHLNQNPLHVNELDSGTSRRSARWFPVLGHVRSQEGAPANPRDTCHFTLYQAIFRSIVLYVFIFSYLMLLFAMSCYTLRYVPAMSCYFLCYILLCFCYVLLSAAMSHFSRFAWPQNEIVNEMTGEYTLIPSLRNFRRQSKFTIPYRLRRNARGISKR